VTADDDDRADVRAAVRASAAVGLAVAAYGVSFGALSVASGLSVLQTCFLSLVMFSGGSQFALIGALLGVRNALYAMRMGPVIGGGWRRVAAVQWTIDETTAVATAQATARGRRVGFWTTGAIIYAGWNLTTLIGALLGDAIGDVRAYGLDAAAAAAFLGLLWPRLTARQPIAVAAAAGVVAAALLPVLPAGLPVLLAAVVAILVGVTNWLGERTA
jgi:predicted branched-subunit amino acid permease